MENVLLPLPNLVEEFIIDTFGKEFTVEKINGIKENGGCYKVSVGNEAFILKESNQAEEYDFYTCYSKDMKMSGVRIPRLLWSSPVEQRYWIAMECIPNTMGVEDWKTNHELYETLYLLHSRTVNKELNIRDGYKPSWNDELTNAVVELFPLDTRDELEHMLKEIQRFSQGLFSGNCWVNGDTNITNWGYDKKHVYLFDWERICVASPAIDLAITIPGLGSLDMEIEKEIANNYVNFGLQEGRQIPYPTENLVSEIKAAKIWSVVEFLYNHRSTLNTTTSNWFVDRLPLHSKALVKHLKDK